MCINRYICGMFDVYGCVYRYFWYRKPHKDRTRITYRPTKILFRGKLSFGSFLWGLLGVCTKNQWGTLVGCFIVFSFLFQIWRRAAWPMWLFFAWDGWVETTFQFHFEHSLHAATCVCVCVSAQCQLFLSNPCHYHGKPGTSQLRCSTCISCLGFSQSQLRHLDRNWLMPKTTTWHFCIKKTHWIWVTPNYWRRLFSKFLEPLELEMTPDKVNPRLQLSSVIVFWLVVWNMFFPFSWE